MLKSEPSTAPSGGNDSKYYDLAAVVDRTHTGVVWSSPWPTWTLPSSSHTFPAASVIRFEHNLSRLAGKRFLTPFLTRRATPERRPNLVGPWRVKFRDVPPLPPVSIPQNTAASPVELPWNDIRLHLLGEASHVGLPLCDLCALCGRSKSRRIAHGHLVVRQAILAMISAFDGRPT